MADADFSSPSPVLRPLKRLKRLSALSSRDWRRLPGKILLSIMSRLTMVDDYVRFGAVCRPWRVVFLEEISSKRPSCSSVPFLLIAPEETDPERKALYSLSNDRVYNFRLRVPDNKICRGSSLGWLVTIKTKKRRIQIRNPFLNRVLDLPRLDNVDYLHKAVLSADPSSSPHDFVVMAIMSRHRGLALCRARDAAWTSIGDWHLFFDVIFFHRMNQFYALLSSGEVMAVDLSHGVPRLKQPAPPIISIHYNPCAYYLVEDLSSGDLLQVLKNLKYNTVEFTVFKLCMAKGKHKWKVVDSIGENVMFLGNNASMLRPASLCPGFEPNSIYYTDDASYTDQDGYLDSPFRSSYGLHLDGVYNLTHRSLRPHYASARPRTKRPWRLPQAVWLEPTLRGAMI